MNARRRAAIARLESRRLSRGAAIPPSRPPRAPVIPSTLDRVATKAARELSPHGDRAQERAVGAGRVLDLPADLPLFVRYGLDVNRCPACGGPIERAATGRPATYCSANCRLQAFRRETKPEVAPTPTPTIQGANSLGKTAAPKSLAVIAADIATPADEYGPARAYCEVREGGYGIVFGRMGALVSEPVGPVFPRPRNAIDLAELLNSRITPTPSTHGMHGAVRPAGGSPA